MIKIGNAGSVFASTEINFEVKPFLPVLLNETLITPVSPDKIGFSGFSGIVHPQLAEALIITNGFLPTFLNLKLQLTYSP